MSLTRQFQSPTVEGTITFHNTTVTVDVRERHAGGKRFRKLRTFQDRESARLVYQSFVKLVEHSAGRFNFTDLAR